MPSQVHFIEYNNNNSHQLESRNWTNFRKQSRRCVLFLPWHKETEIEVLSTEKRKESRCGSVPWPTSWETNYCHFSFVFLGTKTGRLKEKDVLLSKTCIHISPQLCNTRKREVNLRWRQGGGLHTSFFLPSFFLLVVLLIKKISAGNSSYLHSYPMDVFLQFRGVLLLDTIPPQRNCTPALINQVQSKCFMIYWN